jgi:hypothetical protein
MQVFRTIRILKNRGKIDKRGEDMILIVGLANEDPMKMMKS